MRNRPAATAASAALAVSLLAAALPAGATTRAATGKTQPAGLVLFDPGSATYTLAVGAVQPHGGVTGSRSTITRSMLGDALTDARGGLLATLADNASGGSSGVVISEARHTRRVVARDATSAALSGDGRALLVTTSRPGQRLSPTYLLSQPLAGGTATRLATNPAGRELQSVGVSEDGRTAYVCAATPLQGGSQADFAKLRDATVLTVNVATHAVRALRLSGHTDINCTAIVPSPDGTTLAIGLNTTQGDDPLVELVTLATGRVRTLKGHYRAPTGWTPDSKALYVTTTGSDDGGPQTSDLVTAASGSVEPVSVPGFAVSQVVPDRPLASGR